MNLLDQQSSISKRGVFKAGLTCLTLGSCLAVSGCPDAVVVYRQPEPVVVYRPAPYYAPPPTVVYTPPPAPQPAPQVAVSQAAYQLEPLVAPIALYPDPLLAVVLPATTFPQQLQQAGQVMAANPGAPDGFIEQQNWPPSVKAVAHYPSVLNQLTGDPQWTDSVGSAYVNQPGDVTGAIQDLRAQAISRGNLVSNSQQTVIVDAGVISIQPASPSTIYVPSYDPVRVYTAYDPVVYVGAGYAIGPWFVNGISWTGGVIFVGDWHGAYVYGEHGWYRNAAWRGDRYPHWEHDARFGAPPHIERDHYAYTANVREHREALMQASEAHRTAVLENRENRQNQTLQRNEARQNDALQRNQMRQNDQLQRNEIRKDDTLQRNEVRKDDTLQRNQERRTDNVDRSEVRKDDNAQRSQARQAENQKSSEAKEAHKPKKPGDKPE